MARIRIDGAGTAFDCPEDDVILRAALRSGIGFPYECNSGSCGNCRFELVDGEVRHDWDAPPAWGERDRKRNRFLGCQARALGDCRIKVRSDDDCIARHRPVRTRARLVGTRPPLLMFSRGGFDATAEKWATLGV